jgi:putative DNA primase/helicase
MTKEVVVPGTENRIGSRKRSAVGSRDEPVHRILDALASSGSRPTPKRAGVGWRARCPAHPDRRASLTVGAGDGGRALLHCFAGCSFEQIMAALGLDPRDAFPGNAPAIRPRPPRGQRGGHETLEGAIAAVGLVETGRWLYVRSDKRIFAHVVRFLDGGGKTYRQFKRAKSGRWVMGIPTGKRPLFGLGQIVPGEPLFVTEGEKAAVAVQSMGLSAVCSMNGASSPGRTDWRPARAASMVILLPDNDHAGRGYAESVRALIGEARSAPPVYIVDLPGLGLHQDVFDWIAGLPEGTIASQARERLIRRGSV